MPGTYEERRQRILDRLARHGMSGFRFTHLDYLNTANEHFRSARECAQRMIILWAVGMVAQDPDLRLGTSLWLKRVGLWDQASPNEQALLEGEKADERRLAEMSWNGVSSLILAWALQLIQGDPITTDEACTEEQLDEFQRVVPSLGMEVDDFFDRVRLRDLEEVLDENIFNELITTYLRDHVGDTSVRLVDLDVNVSFKRHEALNWLRQFDAQGGGGGWDDVDTST